MRSGAAQNSTHVPAQGRTLKRLRLRNQEPQADDSAGTSLRSMHGKIDTLFQREYHTLAELAHPNIIEVYDYGVDAGGPDYTMELLAGSDLQQLAPQPWPRACALLRDVAAALTLLHARRCTATSHRATCAASRTGAPS
ncbi:MAG TPA: hypothetical protein VK509_09925 [Polyangiales bacterium]|nr:hypothetical protein [Polyangiales bacterium]